MDFKTNKAIYLQIADRLCAEILAGTYGEDQRIPSVREYASQMEVNANTALRSYDFLQQSDIIYNKRGIGYFVNKGARQLILSMHRKDFLEEEVPQFFRKMKALEISIDDLIKLYEP